ncbi:MAG: VOC family protein [Gordonia sp. (in: high G+C Gram-positive bacteria)]
MNTNTTDMASYPDPADPDPFIALRAADIPGWDRPLTPNPAFARALRARLERGATLPQGIDPQGIDMDTTLIKRDLAPPVERPGALPYLVVGDARAAIDWYVEYLGARLRGEPIVMDDNRIGHSELEIGGGAIYLADEFRDLGLRAPAPGAVSVSLMLPVADADAAAARAQDGGASVTREPADSHGTRNATIVDPFGHRWMLAGPPATGAALPNSAEPTRTDRAQAGDIVYLSWQTPDLDAAVAFYGAVLGWEYDPASRQVTNLGHRLGISASGDYGRNTLYCVYAVDDFATARAAILAAGGRAGDTSEVDSDGALVLDAVDDQGVAFSVYVPGPDDPRPALHPSGHGEMSYLTVHTPDSARLRAFYGTVVGWEFTPGRIDDGWEVRNARPQIGVSGGHGESVAVPMWSVDDIAAAVERVRAAGGQVITEPEPQGYGLMALCSDDQGGRFYLGQLF